MTSTALGSVRARPDRGPGVWNVTVDLGRSYTPGRGWRRHRRTQQVTGTRVDAERALSELLAGPPAPQEVPVRHEARGRRSGSRASARWPLGPLLDASHLATVTAVERAAGLPAGTGRRWSTLGLTDTMADRAACALGLHPALVWPGWFDAAEGAPSRR